MKNTVAIQSLVLLISVCLSLNAETLKRRYAFEYHGGASRRGSEARAHALAKKRFLADFIAQKLSPEIADANHEEIEVALDPPEEYLRSFEVKSSTVNPEETQISVTVEGDVDVASIVTSLVNNKVLAFGKQPPKVMFIPSSRLGDTKAPKAIRALVYEKLRQAGLQPVAFEGITQVSSFQGKITDNSLKILAKTALEYNADYLIYIDAERESKPASVGGFICDATISYTIMRPNNNAILGEDLVRERGSGSSEMLAFDHVVDAIAPNIANRAIGQLYESIFADSDVITASKQMLNSITVSVYFKDNSAQVQAIVDGLKKLGFKVAPGAGGPAIDRFIVEGNKDVIDLYRFFSTNTFTAGGGFKASVVEYEENGIGVEIVKVGAKSKKPLKSEEPKPRPPIPSNGKGVNLQLRRS